MRSLVVLAAVLVQLAAGLAWCATSSAASSLPSHDFTTAVHTYWSSADSVRLLMVVVYPDGAQDLPILAVMHGYSQDMTAVHGTQLLLAERGLFTVAPAMRGRNASGGFPDDSAWEITDIVDAVEEARLLYPDETDGGNLNVIGFSGGGGNVFGCLSKFPDTFRFGGAYFGMADYGFDLTYGWYHYGGWSYQSMLRERIGGSPEQVPDAYMARSSLLAVRNNRYTRLQMYVDSEETICPVYNDTTYLRIALDLGHTNVSLNISTPDSLYRWYHSLPHNQPDLIRSFDYFVPGILGGTYAQPVLDRAGEQTILGYLRTEPYELVLAGGLDEVADLSYDIAGTASSPDEAWWFELASRTGRIDPAQLIVHGLAPTTLHVVEEEDVTQGTVQTHLVWSDGVGTLEVAAIVDTVTAFGVYEQSTAGIRGPATSTARQPLLKIFPNPFRHTLVIRGTARADRPVTIYDVAGRLVARLQPSVACIDCENGQTEWRWSGRSNSSDTRWSSGVYFVVLEGHDGMVLGRRVVRIE
jgi:pimeloyl-ACP methyl ester carboxylesterase